MSEPRQSSLARRRARPATSRKRGAEIVVIGCSLGGLTALKIILAKLPEDFRVPIAIAQHRHHTSSDILADHLQHHSAIPIADADDGEPVMPGRIYLAPANYHLLVDGHTFRLSADEAVQYSRPSIDVLFESAADSFRARVVSVVLTGANEDGARGACRIKELGGVVLVQDPEEAEAPVMPAAVIARTRVDRVLRLDAIGEHLGNTFTWDGEGEHAR